MKIITNLYFESIVDIKNVSFAESLAPLDSTNKASFNIQFSPDKYEGKSLFTSLYFVNSYLDTLQIFELN